MAYDKKTNTITVGPDSDFTMDSGIFFIQDLKKISGEKNTPQDIINDWLIVEEWLGCEEREISKADEEKIGRAWKAYLAIGLAPSFSLQPSFDAISKQYKDAGYLFEGDKAPTKVMDVFDRLLATKDDLAVKRKHDWNEEKKKIEAVFKNLKKKTLKEKLISLPRNSRMLILASVVWFMWVAFRTSGNYELLGIYLDAWDEDMFLTNLALPIIVIYLSLKAHQWVSNAVR